MSFVDAIKSCFSKYVTFSGRASRSEFWYFVLFMTIAQLILSILNSISDFFFIISLPFVLGSFLPSIAIGFRRMHDIDKSFWWILIGLIPFIGPIILFVWQCTRGTTGDNRFGPDPLASVNNMPLEQF